jgi:ATP-dependent 26S proteasome regulatory subunit
MIFFFFFLFFQKKASQLTERVKDNNEKVAQNKKLPYLIGHIVEVLDVNADGADDAALTEGVVDDDYGVPWQVVCGEDVESTDHLSACAWFD